MSYNSRLTGEWMFDPPLTGREIRGLPDLEYTKVIESRRDRELDDDIVTVVRGIVLAPIREDSWSYYRLDDELRSVLAVVGGLGREVHGEFIRKGEETGDVERYYVVDDVLVTDQAVLTWPDGTKVDL